MALSPKRSLASARQTSLRLVSAKRSRRVGLACLIIFILYTVAGFYAVPPLLRHFAVQQLRTQLDRNAEIGHIGFNPLTLRLTADNIHIGDAAKNPGGQFIDIGYLLVRASWKSLFRFAPVINEVHIERPRIRVVRYDAAHFNFTDLVNKFSTPGTPVKPDSKPARFAVSNIRIDDGRIDIDDQLLQAHHVVDQFALGIPFIATLASASDIFVTPRLAARIDDSPLAIEGKTKPFSQSRESDVDLRIDRLDLARLAAYIPNTVPVQLSAGMLSTRLNVRFQMTDAAPAIDINGTADIANLHLLDHQKAPILSTPGVLHIDIADAQPLLQHYHLNEIAFDQPTIHLVRDAAGTLNIAALATSPPSPASPTPSKAPSPAAPASSPTAPADTKTPPLDFSVDRIRVTNGQIRLQDASTRPASALSMSALNASVDHFSTVSGASIPYSVQSRFDAGGTLAVKGDVSLAAKQANAQLKVDAFALAPLRGWLDAALPVRIDAGTAHAMLPLHIGWGSSPLALSVGNGEVGLDGLKVTPPGNIAPMALESARVSVQSIDVGKQTASIGAVQISGLSAGVTRLKNGQIDLTTLAPDAPAKPATLQASQTPAASATPAAPAAGPWHYQIGEISVDKSAVNFTDLSTIRPVTLKIAPLALSLKSLSDDLHKPLGVSGQMTLNDSGTFAVNGTVTPAPLSVALRLNSKQVDIAALAAYAGKTLNVTTASARLNASGELTFKSGLPKNAMLASYRGDAAMTQVRLVDKASKNAVAGWSALGISSASIDWRSNNKDSHTRLDLGKVTFSRFYGRVLLDAQGKLNLRDIVNTGPDKPATPADKASEKIAAPASASRVSDASAPPEPDIHVGQIVLEEGRVTYADEFVKPNYSANLVAINGTIGAFASGSTTPAPVNIKANLSGSGPITITGKVNPLIPKPALDLTATANDIELTDLTTYSAKYAGFPITKGKLNVDVHYELADDQLKANNHLFIDQLTFGDHVDNPGATRLPVRLAVSLLKNSRGQIDLNIPVSGALSNPQFSVSSVIWHAVLNLITRAVTAPFSLLTHAFGGGGMSADALQYVVFDPGSATLSDTAHKKLDAIGEALKSKPSISLMLTAHADPAADATTLRTRYVEEMLKRAKLSETDSSAAKDPHADLSTITVDAAEYSRYLTKAYKAADFSKPRNLIGMTKTLPEDEMEKALYEHAPDDASAVHALAQQRADAIRDYLAKNIDAARIGITIAGPAASTSASGRVDFSLK